MDVAVFLNARYDEAEVAAQACKPGPWMEGSERPHLVNGVIYGQSTGWPGGGHLEQVCMVNIDYAGEAGPANLAHMACYDPAWVLTDIAAKRKLLALWQEIQADVYSPDANKLAEDMLQQLLAPYGKRAVWNSDTGYQINE